MSTATQAPRHIAFTTKPFEGKYPNVHQAAKLRYVDDGRRDLWPAADVARQLERVPEGCRCIHLPIPLARDNAGKPWWLDTDQLGRPVPTAESFRTLHAHTVGSWFEEYHRIGGQVDWLLLDFEYALDWHSVYTSRVTLDERIALANWLNSTTAGAQMIRKLLHLSLIEDFSQWGARRDYRELLWNRTLHAYVADVLHDVFYEPVAKFFPEVQLSNFEHAHYSNHVRVGNHRRYVTCWTAGHGCHVGTHSGLPFYGRFAWTTTPDHPDPPPRDDRLSTTWAALSQGVTWGKSLALGRVVSGGVPWMAWISGYYQHADGDEGLGLLAERPEWAEQIRHLAASGCRTFALWHRKPTKPGVEELSRVLSECDDNLPVSTVASDHLEAVFNPPGGGLLGSGCQRFGRWTLDRPGAALEGRWL
jgi:hypothetical protein